MKIHKYRFGFADVDDEFVLSTSLPQLLHFQSVCSLIACDDKCCGLKKDNKS